MAIDKKLQIFDDEGNPVDYDILASDVKFNDGKDLPTKLDEMEDEIGEGGYTPPQGGIPKTDLAQSVQDTLDDVADKVDKETGKGLSTNDYTDADKTKLVGLPTNPVQSISVNGTAQSKDQQGNVNIEVQAGGLTKEDISVETQGDGTININVGEDTYTVNLNHTHEEMAKLVVCEESDLPSTLDNDTIYAITDSGETEIEKLIIRDMEFAGGGGSVVDDSPKLLSPLSGKSIDFGDNQTATLLIRGKNLLAPLTLVVSGDVTVTSNGSSVSTISASDANNGVTLTLTKGSNYSGGSLAISSDELETRTVNFVYEFPTGFLANKAWSDKTLVDAPGYCIGPKFNVATGHSYEVEFGFTRPSDDTLKYGLVGTPDANFISAGTAGSQGTGYWAPTTGTSRSITSIAGSYGSCTFKMSELANCYIKDTTANSYVWKGNNVT